MKYIVAVVGGSDEEDLFERAETVDQARRIAKRHDCSSYEEYKFDTPEEVAAFVKGYEYGVGWMGDGLYYVKLVKR